jgi:DNA-binding NtrC family response regulator
MTDRHNTQDAPAIRLLLVDDEVEFAAVLAKRLKRRAITATIAHNGTEAIQLLRRNDFDVAVLDLKMEGLDGIQVLKIFQTMAPEMPVIMLTGHGCQISAQEGRAQGAFDYLSKPYDFEELTHKIREAYGHGRSSHD